MDDQTIKKIVDRLAVQFARRVPSRSFDVDDLKSVGWLAARQTLDKRPNASEGTIKIAVWRDLCDVARRERLRKTVPIDERNGTR